MSEEENIISFDDALKLLPEGEDIHTFRQPSVNIFVGSDWDREEIIDLLKSHTIQRSGENARAMNHGLAVKVDDGFLFIQTEEEENESNS